MGRGRWREAGGITMKLGVSCGTLAVMGYQGEYLGGAEITEGKENMKKSLDVEMGNAGKC